jgi:hypothetical protein
LIIKMATAWAAAVEARFRPSLAKWLVGRGWERQPPAKPCRARVRSAPRSYGRHKPSLMDAMLRAGGLVQ